VDPPQGKLPHCAGNLDFRALAAFGNHVWIAGAPGTCVLHSPDGGQTWQLFRTEQTTPIRGLAFIDEYRGWAVGSLGTILHTRDGGQSWRVQHSGGSRVALLGIFSAARAAELIALQSGSDVSLAKSSAAATWKATPRVTISPPRRGAAALVAAGARNRYLAIPLREAGLSQSTETSFPLNAANDGRGTERLEDISSGAHSPVATGVIMTEMSCGDSARASPTVTGRRAKGG
jgi:photosystem II stability/assembly factor-like uncharacterized protein